MSSKNEDRKIEAVFVLEVIGKPKEHLVEFLEDLIKKIDAEQGISVTNKNIREPQPSKAKPDFFSTYAEIELEADDPLMLISLTFKYMPSHVEVVYPENFNFSNNSLSDTLNEITRRLHAYDELAKIIQFENAVLKRRLQEAGQNPTMIQESKPLDEKSNELKEELDKEKQKKEKKNSKKK